MPIDNEYLSNIQKLITIATSPAQQVQQQCNAILKPIAKTYSQYSEIVSSLSQFLETLNQALAPYCSLNEKTAQILSDMAESYKSLSIDNDAIQAFSSIAKSCDFSSIAAASSAVISAMAKPYSNEDLELSESNSDYVVVNKVPIKEFKIPDTIAIPIGNNRVRIKTDLFFTILGIIIAAIFSLISCLSDISSKQNEITAQELKEEQQQTELIKKILEEQQQQTELLYEIFDGIDISNSSQKEYLEDIRSTLQAQNSILQDDEVIPGSAP